MIRRAIDRGVSPNRLAIALGIDVSTIHKKATLLDGVCKEATELLKDREFTTKVSSVLRQMKPLRQVECVELMALIKIVALSGWAKCQRIGKSQGIKIFLRSEVT